ncbi:MAG: hypothetical protein RIC35_22910 [Marinoscillum sp.]
MTKYNSHMLMFLVALLLGFMSPGFSVTPEQVIRPVTTEIVNTAGVQTQKTVGLYEVETISAINNEARNWGIAVNAYHQKTAVLQRSLTTIGYAIPVDRKMVPRILPKDDSEELIA